MKALNLTLAWQSNAVYKLNKIKEKFEELFHKKTKGTTSIVYGKKRLHDYSREP